MFEFKSQSHHRKRRKENLVVEIDYDRLANALIKAEEKIAKEKANQLIKEKEKHQLEWEKTLKCQRYRGNKKIYKFLDVLTRPFRIAFGIITFSKKNATSDNATYALFRTCNEFFLTVYQFFFYFLTLCTGIYIWKYDKFSKIFSIGKISCLWLGILFFIIARTIRVAKLESANSQNKETITTIFNALVSFTAMIFAIIAVIVALLIGG